MFNQTKPAGGWRFDHRTGCRVEATARRFNPQPQCDRSPTLIPAFWNLLTVSLLNFYKKRFRYLHPPHARTLSLSHTHTHEHRTPYRRILTQIILKAGSSGHTYSHTHLFKLRSRCNLGKEIPFLMLINIFT